MKRKLAFLISLSAIFAISTLSVISEELQSHAENVQIIFDPIFGHNHNGTNSAKLAANSVNTTQLVDNSVTNSKISGPLSVVKGGTGLSNLGSVNQILRVNNGGTALEYATISSGNGQEGDISHTLSKALGDYSSPTIVLASSIYNATGDFSDSYTTNSGWISAGSNVLVDDSSFPDQLKFNAAAGGADNRQYKSLGTTASNSIWTAKFDWKQTADANGPDALIFVLSAGIGDPSSANQDEIGVWYENPSGTRRLTAFYKDGSGGITLGSFITQTQGTQYYLTLERTSTTNVKLSIFTDAARTAHTTGSPINLTIPSTVVGLTTIQHSVRNSGGSASATLTAEIDNLTIGPLGQYSELSAIDGNTSTEWRSNQENKPWIRLDLSGNKDLASLTINLNRTSTTASTLKIYSSTDTTFVSSEVLAYVNVSDFTDDTYRYILPNYQEDRRYVLIEAQENNVVFAVNEVKVRHTLTDWATKHFHAKRDVVTTNSFFDNN